jgi:hypothetical protein
MSTACSCRLVLAMTQESACGELLHPHAWLELCKTVCGVLC